MRLNDALEILEDNTKTIPNELQKLVIEEMNENRKSAAIFLSKYCRMDEEGNLLEYSKSDVWRRVVSNLTPKEMLQTKFYNMLINNEFIPGGRITASIGTNKKTTSFNCYVGKAPQDSLEDIFRCLKDMALTYSAGGGFGFDVSNLRPVATAVDNSAEKSTGPVSFLDLFSHTTSIIGQHNRRGALMITMSCEHPDILDFINSKYFDLEKINEEILSYVKGDTTLYNLKQRLLDLYKVNYANLSVRLSDKFMKAVEKDLEWELKWTGKVKGKEKTVARIIKAKELWDAIIHNSWATGEPGVMFWDNIVKEHNGEYYAPLSSTNPCGEEPLPENGNCNLGHVNLSTLVDSPYTEVASFNFVRFKEIIKDAICFLDNVIDYGHEKHALQEQKNNSVRDRRIGLGITGLADALFKMKIKYDSKQAEKFVKEIFSVMSATAYRASIDLAKDFGPFPAYDVNKYLQSNYVTRLISEINKTGVDPEFENDLKKYGIRNVTLLTVAPVGTGSEILGGVSSGIEPVFAASFKRRVILSDGNTHDFEEYAPVFKDYLMKTGKSHLPEYAVVSHEIDYNYRIKLQSIIQNYVDASISSTINLPNNVSEKEVADIYFSAWKNGLKGLTVYREGSREGVLYTKSTKGSLIKKLFKDKKDIVEPLPEILDAIVYAVKYCPSHKARISIAKDQTTGEPISISIVTKKPEDESMAKQLSILLTALLRRDVAQGISSAWIIEELKGIVNLPGVFHKDSDIDKGVFICGLAQASAYALEKFLNRKNKKSGITKTKENHNDKYELCPLCRTNSLIYENGCSHCTNCGYNKCG